MPRFRFTIRRMMVAVATVGMIFGVAAIWQRHRTFLKQAAGHEAEARICEINSDDNDKIQHQFDELRKKAGMGADPNKDSTLEYIRIMRLHGDHCRRLAHKYERAAHYPWLPVAPDPPVPE